MQMQKYFTLGLFLTATTFTAMAADTKVEAAAAAVVEAKAVDSSDLKKQIEKLKHQVAALDKKQKEADAKALVAAEAKVTEEKKAEASSFPEKFIPVPGSNTAVRFGGRVKIDGGYAANQRSSNNVSGTFFDLRNIALNSSSTEQQKGYFSATAQGSRIFFDSVTHTSAGDITGFFKMDFFGSGTKDTSTSYGFRMRQAVITFGGLRIGQDESNFADYEMAAYHFENFGMGVLPRRAQIRYNFTPNKNTVISISAEKPDSDYVINNGATVTDKISWSNDSGLGKSTMPDLTARVRYNGDNGFISFGAIGRRLGIENTFEKDLKTVQHKLNKMGYGFSSGFQARRAGSKSHAFGQLVWGKSLGYLVQDGNAPMYYDQANGKLEHSTTLSAILGYSHSWTDCFKTVLAASFVKMSYPKDAVKYVLQTDVINKDVRRIMFNMVYNPVATVDVAFEVMYGSRKTMAAATNADEKKVLPEKKGKSLHFVTSFVYRF